MIRAILLDAGGVLLDETAMEQRIAEFIVEVIGQVEPSYCLEDYWNDVEEAVVRYAPKVYAYVLWKHCSGVRELFERLYGEFRARQREADMPLVAMAGIEQEIKELAERYSLVLAGQYGGSIYSLLDQIGIGTLFANRLSQDDFGITKPDPRYLIQLAERAGFEPSECVMVGDRIDNDVIPARQAGMGTVLVRTGIHRNQQARLPQELPEIDLLSTKGLAATVLATWE